MVALCFAESINEMIILFILSYHQGASIDVLTWEHWEIWCQIYFPVTRNIKQELIDQTDFFILPQPAPNRRTTKYWR